MVFSNIYICMCIFICIYKGYKNGRLKSVFSKAIVIGANDFGKYMVCQTWERH